MLRGVYCIFFRLRIKKKKIVHEKASFFSFFYIFDVKKLIKKRFSKYGGDDFSRKYIYFVIL